MQFFERLLRFVLKMKYEQSKGNAFAQGMHDGVTLANHSKYQGYALQFISPDFDENLVVCFGFKKSVDNTDRALAEKFSGTFTQVTGLPLKVIGTIRSDEAATGVAKTLGVESESCYMHTLDKIPASGIADLTRSKGGQVVNPFEEGAELMQQAQDIATHFSRSGDKK